MKIISKYKDYYDYLQGVYGMDEILTFDRRSDNPLHKPEDGKVFTYTKPNLYRVLHYEFHICGKIYNVFKYKDNFYHTLEELNELNQIIYKEINKYIGIFHPYNGSHSKIEIRDVFKYTNPKNITIKQEDFNKIKTKTNINKKLRKPILLLIRDEQYEHNIVLKDFGFAKWISAHDMFVNISSFMGWLVDNPPIPDKMTNVEKIKSHGFDEKQSFRKRK